jgi:NADH-quinone oxidoreductase subunit K
MFTLASIPTAGLSQYLLVAGLLFAIGLTGVVLRRNIIIVFMCLELMLSAANLTMVAFSRFYLDEKGLPDIHGQMLVFFVITVAAAEVAVGLAIIVALYRTRHTIHSDELQSLKG